MPNTYSDWSSVATIVAVAVACVSAILVIVQIKRSEHATRSNTASEAYRDYIRACFERPWLSCSEGMVAYVGKPLAQWDRSGADNKVEECLWFLSYALNSLEQVHLTRPADDHWLQVIRSVVGYHGDLLREDWAYNPAHYAPAFAAIVKAAI